MKNRHPYAVANSPGRVLTTAGAISVVLVLITATVCGLGESLLNGFGAWGFTGPLDQIGAAKPGVLALLLAYPALFAVSLLGEAWTSSRAFAWLGRRVRGSLCLLWTVLVCAVLVLHIAGGANAILLVPSALVFGVGGVAVRWIERQATPSWQPFSRILPAGMLTLATVVHAIIAFESGLSLAPLQGLLASGSIVGTLLLSIGGIRDVHHRRQRLPRRLFCRDAMHRALRMG